MARLVFGILLILIAIAWAAFWSAGAAMTTETGIWNSTTWAAMAVAGLGLVPAVGGLYLLASGVAKLMQPKGAGSGGA